MKGRVVHFLSTFTLMLLLFNVVQANSNVLMGDADLNGEVNSTDYILIRRHVLGIGNLTGSALNAADVNNDNQVNSLDCVLLRRHILGIIDLNKRKFEKVEDSLMTYSGLTVVSYGGYMNGESFQQDGIVSYNGYQYTAFWNTNRSVVFARRVLPSGEWEKFEFTDYKNTENNAHNTISIGICPNDGTIHLAFDHHGHDLRYRRSVIGFANEPKKHPWTAASFGSVTSNLGNTKVTLVTYPKFITTPQGNLLFEYRYGSSGSGDQHLWEYSGTTNSWTNIGKYINGISDSINAYIHGISYGKDSNRLHVTWCWRQTPNASTNHDLLYIYSDDNGRTWRNNNGVEVARTGSTYVTKNSSGITVWRINQNRGLINQEHHIIDSQGRVHVLLAHMADSNADDSNFERARTKSEYFHYWRDKDGKWQRNPLGCNSIANFRGCLAVSSKDSLYAIIPDMRIAYASAKSNWTDWTIIDNKEQGRFFSDPLIDTARLKYEDKLSIFYPAKNSPNIYVLTYNID